MTEDELDNLLNHPYLIPAWKAVRMAEPLFTGIPEVRYSVSTLQEGPSMAEKTRDELREMWSNQGLYEGGIDWKAPEPPSGDAGLTVVELKDDK